MGWYNYTIIIHILPVVYTWHGCQPRHAILSKEKYQETSQIIWLCPIPWEISKDESYDLKVSYSLRNTKIRFRWFGCVIILVINIERRVIWFERVLFIKQYLNTSQMIWMCPNPWEISKDGSDELTVSSSLQTGRLVGLLEFNVSFVTVMDISRPCQPEKLIPLLPWPGFDPSFSGHNDRRAITSEWTRLRLKPLSHRGWLQTGRRNWYASSLYYMSGWVARYSMISDSGRTWQWVKESS